MLIHLVPCFLTSRLSGPDCELVDLKIPDWDLELKYGRDLVTRRPYPNKRYQVGCRKVGQKAMNGILIEAPEPVSQFQVSLRWAVDAELIVTHDIAYRVLDAEYSATSDDASMWQATHHSLGDWGSRYPDHLTSYSPMNLKMSYALESGGTPGLLEERVSRGRVIYRRQQLDLPSVEPERLLGRWGEMNRVPKREHAFAVA